jgi:L,D-transpeptidase ErfK/SrfK
MRREGLAVKESYPPGPKNPVGSFVIQTTLPGILIHETIDPSSVYKLVSHGCVRLLRKDMEQLFGAVSVGMSGKIIYRPIKVAHLADGKVLMEANEDVYGKIKDMQETARKILSESGVLNEVDFSKVEKVVQEKAGIPVDVTADRP